MDAPHIERQRPEGPPMDTATTPAALPGGDGLAIRRANFPDVVAFHAPGLRRYRTSEFDTHDPGEFISISLTGQSCALDCEHCKTEVLKTMTPLPQAEGSLFTLCARAAENGARGVLISGGCDSRGRVPLMRHIPDLLRVRQELGLKLRVHPGLPDPETCAALGEVGLDGAMVDIIGHEDTIREVYHLDAAPEDYGAMLAELARHGVPAVPHIVLGLHYGRFLGEWRALEMIAAHPLKLLVLVVLMPLSGTTMADAAPPPLEQVGAFFELARQRLPAIPIMLGCARPMGAYKQAVDRMAIDAGFNGIAYPAQGIVEYARQKRLQPEFYNSCCGVV
ncbi:MAG: radical SAM protein [bacterium]